jgi:hypothetical protein
MLHCSAVLGQSVRHALPVLERFHVKIAWDTGTGTANYRPIPDGYVAGGIARSSVSVSIRVTAKKPADSNAASRHGRHC